MAIPVLVSAELFPWNDINGTMLPDAVSDLNKELKSFFDSKVDLVISTGADGSNVTEVTTVHGTNLPEQEVFVQATVVIGFGGDITIDAARELAASFAREHSKRFNHISVEVLDPAAVVAPGV
jgi:hypothetical protein